MQQLNYTEGTFGGYKPVDAKHPMTGYYISQTEYDAIIKKMNSTSYDLTIAQQEYEHQLSELTATSAKETETHKQAIQQLEDQIKQLVAELATANDLNKNLIRISKERANVDRKLRPKKAHSGYVLLFSQQKVRKVRQGRDLINDYIWEARIQTPYLVKLSHDQLITLVATDNPFADLIGPYQKIEMLFRANYQTGYWECTLYFYPKNKESED